MNFCRLELLLNVGLLNDRKLVTSGIYLIEALVLYIVFGFILGYLCLVVFLGIND